MFWIVISCAISFGVFYFIAQIGVYYDKKEVEKIKENECIVEGIIIKTGSMKGSYVVAEYYIEGNRYQKRESSYSDDIVIGEKFKIRYDRTDPSSSRIIYEEPFFKTSDKTSITSGRIIQVDSYTFRFEYTIKGIEYKKFQHYPKGKNFKEGATYTVEYLIDKPQIAVLKIQ
ncbi:MAG: hypothetical protein WCI53_02380 [Bacteroidota bacterium]